MTKKPEGMDEFHSLLGKLAKVPKAQLDREVDKAKLKSLAKKRAKKRKK
ncbi:MAG: hypothetical protein ACKVP0_00325 [Pirellulaceae bacterium]